MLTLISWSWSIEKRKISLIDNTPSFNAHNSMGFNFLPIKPSLANADYTISCLIPKTESQNSTSVLSCEFSGAAVMNGARILSELLLAKFWVLSGKQCDFQLWIFVKFTHQKKYFLPKINK